MDELLTINTDPTIEEMELLEAQDSKNPENVVPIESHEEDGANLDLKVGE